MKLSLKWINEFVDVSDQKPDALVALLVSAGLEVESVEDPSKAFNNVVVGQVVELGKHPNADKLTLCQIDVGDGKHRQIVCGAKNHRQGDKVVVALPGAVLPGDFAIKLSKIRDVESQGMLCSESELAFKKESEGILILPKDAPVGKPFAQYWGLDDIIFDISITPNRADCLSHLGLARELSCLLNRPLKLKAPVIKAGALKNKITVAVNDSSLCPRYTGRSVFDVKIAESPAWLKQRVQALGMNSINNVVDVTNFVMLELGQPLHAFDSDALRGGKIIVERAKPKEVFKTFDGSEKTLTGEELTIRDGERAVALAGVVGGLNSGVTDATQNIFIESAYFSPKGVRHTSRALGIDTESSYRNSRGIDIDGVINGLNRAAELIAELAGGQVSADVVDIYPSPAKKPQITVRNQTLNDRLGYDVKMPDFIGWMKRLHCKVISEAKDSAVIETPLFRVDLEQEMDLVEEYGRLNGYDKIPMSFPPLTVSPKEHAAQFVNNETVAEHLVREGYLEARNYAFLSAKWQAQVLGEFANFQQLGLPINGAQVPVLNPLSEETGVMRVSLLPSLIQNLIHNEHRGVQTGRLFEIGPTFYKAVDGAKVVDAKYPSPYVENQRAALLAWGHTIELWSKPKNPVVYDIKSAIEGLVGRLNGKIDFRKLDIAKIESAKPLPQFLHPGQTATLFYEGKTIGFIGTLHPAFRDAHKIRSDVAVAEVDIEALMRGQPRTPKIKAISKFQAVERDFSLVVANTVTAGELIKEAKSVVGPLLQDIEVFDVFRGGAVPEGMQSVSIRITVQDQAATLADDRIQALQTDLLRRLGDKFAAKVR